MMICVKYKGELRNITGAEVENIECKNMKELLLLLRKKYGRKALKAMQRCHIVVNGKRADSNFKFKDRDEVVFIPVCCGG